MVHVMAAADLGRTAMAAPVVGDDAIALLEEEHHLGVPVIRRQRPAVAEHDGLPFAPVLVKISTLSLVVNVCMSSLSLLWFLWEKLVELMGRTSSAIALIR